MVSVVKGQSIQPIINYCIICWSGDCFNVVSTLRYVGVPSQSIHGFGVMFNIEPVHHGYRHSPQMARLLRSRLGEVLRTHNDIPSMMAPPGLLFKPGASIQ